MLCKKKKFVRTDAKQSRECTIYVCNARNTFERNKARPTMKERTNEKESMGAKKKKKLQRVLST